MLLDCDIEEKNQEIYALAKEIKEEFYGNRIVMFAPLYLSNYCINGCEYCPYHARNKHIARKKLSQEEIVKEVTALQDMGHKRLALEAGEDPVNNPIEYILESIQTIYSIKHKKRSHPSCQCQHCGNNCGKLPQIKRSRNRNLYFIPGNLSQRKL